MVCIVHYTRVRKTRNDLGLPQSIFLPEDRISYVIATTSSKILKYNLFCCFAVLVVQAFS